MLLAALRTAVPLLPDTRRADVSGPDLGVRPVVGREGGPDAHDGGLGLLDAAVGVGEEAGVPLGLLSADVQGVELVAGESSGRAPV
ncbi:hypothetical protein [Streptomyces sp. NPDC056255]|uniref:hypothetical protein n=1 Tax=Streptomyces sp. NPDC056255 TaxID=3345764 RepID=UPI0035D63D66